MDHIDLPWLDPDATVGQAVGRIIEMKSSTGVGAVVTERGGKPAVLPLDLLITAARSDPEAPLAGIAPLGQGRFLPREMRSRSLDLDFAPIETLLDEQSFDFGVVRLFGSIVHVVTRHETVAATFRSDLKVCRCTGPNGHVLLAGDLDEAGKCNFDDYPVVCA